MSKPIILSTSYLPSLNYLRYLINSDVVYIEKYSNYIKQSPINRCEILAANGRLPLSVPVQKGRTVKQKIKDVKISYATDWQRLHLKSIESAYRSSAFYEYYIDAFMPFYTKKYEYLFDYNLLLLQTILKELEVAKEIKFTEEFYNEEFEAQDLRYRKGKKALENLLLSEKHTKYYQVFNKKFDFQYNLSIIDLLFNEGTNAYTILDYF